mmetsp:Transcript_25677/g.44971  ORF Transcript_25677/g.44971 Transcript_25677/m.44971 type:complete len:345 (+) Transcript_25677:2746-3780(+)
MELGRLTMDDFFLIKVIGKGSYGKVLLVRKINSNEVLAMKILRKDFIARRNQIQHTRTERSVLERVKHPFIVELKYAFQTPLKLYFCLEYCPGGELFFHLSRSTRFDESRACFYAACIVLALQHLHAQNIVYRDLKPENVLIDHEGYAKITDFGLSKENIMDNSSTHTFCGTPEYLAPEILARRGHNKSVDWWSLGALIFEMLTGLPPFYNRDRERLFHSIMYSELSYPTYISATCKDLISSLFVKEPTQRLGSGKRDAKDIMEHPWFASIDWKRLEMKEIRPPFVPKLDGPTDTRYFDPEFIQIPPVDSVPKDSRLDSGSSSSPTYAGFTYNKQEIEMNVQEA